MMKKNPANIFAKTVLVIAISMILCHISGCDDNRKATTGDSVATSTSGDQGVGRYKDISLAPLDKKMADKGKVIFESKCWSCHDPSKETWVGPGLKNVTQRRTPAWILNMITNTNEMVQKDSIAHRLLSQIDMKMHVENVSDEDARQILEYLRLNDGEKSN